jgi:SNF2 family DNA or RNA helicase
VLTPRPYQLEGRDFLAGRQFALLADEMRVGKTPQAILAAEVLNTRESLVICPAIAVEHWNREWTRWGAPGHVTVVSYDRAKLHWDHLCSSRWSAVIVDEAHFAKNPEAARTKLIYGKTGIGWHTDHLWALSGTPAPKHAGELWPMLCAFGAIGKMSYAEFTRRYCTWNELEGRITGTREEMIPELKCILNRVMLRRTRKQVAPDMPDIDFQFLEMKVEGAGPVMMSIPANVPDDQLLDWLERHQTIDRDDRIAVAMAKIGPLGDEIEFAIANDLLKQTVVFGWHIEPLQALTRQLRARGIIADCLYGAISKVDRELMIEDFHTGELQVLLAQIMAAGTARDFSAARHAYFLEMDWVPGNNVQAANRLVNMDKLDKVTIDVATLPRSSDDRVQKVLLRRVRELAKLY